MDSQQRMLAQQDQDPGLPGSAVPLVLLHGIQGTARTWDAIAPRLRHSHPVVTPNLRGRADALQPDDPDQYRLEDFADDLSSVLAKVECPPVVVAWSMGVSVVLTVLRMQPAANIRALVLVSGSPCLGDEAVWFHSETIEQLAVEAETRRKNLALVEAATPVAVAASWQHVKLADLRPVLRSVRQPTLVLHGASDDQSPIAHGRFMAKEIPGARLEIWEGVGHNPMAADPERFSASVMEFAKSLT